MKTIKNPYFIVGLLATIGMIIVVTMTWIEIVAQASDYLTQLEPSKRNLPSIVYDRSGQKLGQFGSGRHLAVGIDEIPVHVQQAFISAEDRYFWTHFGICIPSIVRAMLANLKEQRFAEGASTLTQQLIRHLFLSPEKKLRRKIKEMLLAIALETKISKSEILERYLNNLFFGHGVIGIGAAAEFYFQKTTKELSIAESALLAGMIQAPSRYNLLKREGRARARERQRYVLNRMVEDGYLEQEDLTWISETPIHYKASSSSLGEFGHVMFAVKRELENLVQGLNLESAGLRIETGLDLATLQKINQISKRIAHWPSWKDIDEEFAIVVLEVESSEVLGLVGAKDFRHSQFNRATQMKRPVGAMVLPLTIGIALDHGFQLGDSLYTTTETFSPNPRSEPTLYHGLADHMLLESTRLGLTVGLNRIQQFFDRLGWKMNARYGFELIMGQISASPLELAAAYAGIANQGVYREPRLIRRVYATDQRLIFQSKNSQQRIFHEESAFAMAKALSLINQQGKKDQNNAMASYFAVDTSSQNLWQVVFNEKTLLMSWIGSDSGRRVFQFESADQISQLVKKINRILVEDSTIIDRMSLKEPKGIRYHWIQSPISREHQAFVPYTSLHQTF